MLVRIVLMITFSAYGVFERTNESGVSAWMLLLVSLFIAVMCFSMVFKEKTRLVCILLGMALFLALMILGERSFILLGIYALYELLSMFTTLDVRVYLLPILGVFFPSSVSPLIRFVVVIMLSVVYIQNNYIIRSYKKQMIEDTITEQNLKRDMQEQEYAARMQQRKNMLMAENQILEERASLSQTLHDKLGHSINGSVYQLEAAKVLLRKDPEKTENIIQAVINQLRGGMDEIRSILRKERPAKRELAMVQLQNLCEDCNSKGVKTELTTEGDTDLIPDTVWEVILDNAFEAISNSMKYSKCKQIDIKLVVMKQRVRVTISDDGIGCQQIVDGMGFSGMRQRVRATGGTLDFAGEVGFTVTMLLPMDTESK